MIERIGIEKVEWIEGNHEIPNFTHEELREKAAFFRKLKRDLLREP